MPCSPGTVRGGRPRDRADPCFGGGGVGGGVPDESDGEQPVELGLVGGVGVGEERGDVAERPDRADGRGVPAGLRSVRVASGVVCGRARDVVRVEPAGHSAEAPSGEVLREDADDDGAGSRQATGR